MRTEETLALLERENPVGESEVPAPQSAEARALKERIMRGDLAETTTVAGVPPAARRLRFRIAAAGATVAAIALGALGVLPGDGVLPGNRPATASAVDRAAAALAGPDDTILHTVARITQTGPGAGGTIRAETWQLTSPPFDERHVTYEEGGVRTESASVNGRPVLYDPVHNSISILPETGLLGDRRGPGGPLIDGGAQRLRDRMLALLESGNAREDGRLTVDGRDAIRIVSSVSEVTLVVDAGSYEPIAWRAVGENGVTEARFETYETLPATEANLSLLSLREQHPDARVDRRFRGFDLPLRKRGPNR